MLISERADYIDMKQQQQQQSLLLLLWNKLTIYNRIKPHMADKYIVNISSSCVCAYIFCFVINFVIFVGFEASKNFFLFKRLFF